MAHELAVQHDLVEDTRSLVASSVEREGIVILPSIDAQDCLRLVGLLDIRPRCTILDPWYNRGVGGTRDDYDDYIAGILRLASGVSDHVFLWGYPDIVARILPMIPPPLELVAWLTWYYKNAPSVVRGWRPSQEACLHLAHPGAKLHPEHFFNEIQKQKYAQGKLRYIPGPTTVIEEPLLVGFVGKKEQTGHPAQKPVAVYEKLILMTTNAGELVLDPMSGSGTTGEAARRLGRLAIISDYSEEYTAMAEQRLRLRRTPVAQNLGFDLGPVEPQAKSSEWTDNPPRPVLHRTRATEAQRRMDL